MAAHAGGDRGATNRCNRTLGAALDYRDYGVPVEHTPYDVGTPVTIHLTDSERIFMSEYCTQRFINHMAGYLEDCAGSGVSYSEIMELIGNGLFWDRIRTKLTHAIGQQQYGKGK